MLEPGLQDGLKRVARTTLLLHLAQIGAPIFYIITAVAVKQTVGLTGEEDSQSSAAVMWFVAGMVGVLAFPVTALLKRRLFAPERIVSDGANVQTIGAAFTRAQLILDGVASVPAVVGFFLCIVTGNMNSLILLAIVSMGILVLHFPRYETLEAVVMARIMQGETIRTPDRESGGNA